MTLTRCTIMSRAWTVLFLFSVMSLFLSFSSPVSEVCCVIPVRGKPKWSPLGCSLRGSRQWKSYLYFSAGSECLPVSAYYVKCAWNDEAKIHLTCLNLTSVDSLRLQGSDYFFSSLLLKDLSLESTLRLSSERSLRTLCIVLSSVVNTDRFIPKKNVTVSIVPVM